jgi:hypothetical protein
VSSPIHRFAIGHDDGHGRMYFEVRIFANQAGMHEHYRRSRVLSRSGEHRDPSFADAEALCAPRMTELIAADGSVTSWDPRLGVLLFHAELLRPAVVVHEITHAALTYYRERRHRGGQPGVANFGRECSWREEAFAHLVSALWQQMNAHLHDLGLW